ncbi:nickel pincer cofactor biosynthesis protein LarC [Thioalkalivibrio sp. XN279]|uniref:nickel pincer cofactor biosynthesis protein LarC n=1 Tax=Thioalkalivibrio sp. XN279 TaxID=2714953 RepID=UPI0014072867|nr:nickel pincer cofactor biosynthesis protein LarC [Thioalkalivibrio sp. XN279]NHA15357.1 nickel pincer cofactor biosynthesis protein LarC [Thioalkalivibrio sp. XN279]
MSVRALLVEPYSGISGDMFVAAASALTGCEQEVLSLPGVLGLRGVNCRFSDARRSHILCRRFEVLWGGDFLEDEGGADKHRSLAEILEMIDQSTLDQAIKGRASRMFERLGAVEAGVHGIALEEVHFHEIGALDSIMDIVAAALCIERLGVGAAFSTPICVGSGMTQASHGGLPVPAPATERLLHGMPTVTGKIGGEWTTPTGALILAELGVEFDWPAHTVMASAYGGGCRDIAERPNVLRLRLAETRGGAFNESRSDTIMELRCNLDDLPGELLGADLVAHLLDHGARDVTIYPVIMKKGRPGHVLEILVDRSYVEDIANLLLESTSTIGVRMSAVSRITLARSQGIVGTPFGNVAVKMVQLPSGRTRVTPEFEACRQLAEAAGVAVLEVYTAALKGNGA